MVVRADFIFSSSEQLLNLYSFSKNLAEMTQVKHYSEIWLLIQFCCINKE